ncbi:MAG: hypothetical protein ACE5DI_00070 [Candidatus Micrarchaeia archaeon]
MALKIDFKSLNFFRPRKRPVHEMKWPLPEEKRTVPIQDPEKIIGKLRKLALFTSGGQFLDVVHAKQYGNGVMAYFIIRTDKRTEKEKVFFEGWMLQESEKLGMDVAIGPELMENLEKLGYKQAFPREETLWQFKHAALSINVYEITNFGAFLEISIPQTKLDKTRKHDEKVADKLLEHLKVKTEEVLPTDVTSLQLAAMLQMQQGQKQQGENFKLGEETGQ